MASKIMIAISKSHVAPRFDLAVEAVIAEERDGRISEEPRLLVMSEASGDELCELAVREAVDVVICGGIDEIHFEYLQWKNIAVIDGVIGPYASALELYVKDELQANDIIESGSDTPLK